MKNTTASRG